MKVDVLYIFCIRKKLDVPLLKTSGVTLRSWTKLAIGNINKLTPQKLKFFFVQLHLLTNFQGEFLTEPNEYLRKAEWIGWYRLTTYFPYGVVSNQRPPEDERLLVRCFSSLVNGMKMLRGMDGPFGIVEKGCFEDH